MILDKRLVDELIRVTKKYYRTRDTDIIDSIRNAGYKLSEECNSTFDVNELIKNLSMFAQYSGIETNEDIYKALEAFGIIVEDKEKENENN